MKITRQKPTVFIGSSEESREIVEVVASMLAASAVVIPWYKPTIWNLGFYTLESLLRVVPECDFAILIFGHDDTLISRQTRFAAPRDNVIFELGLFMSNIGRERTFVLASKKGGVHLKILSDIAGLGRAEFDEPRSKKNLPKALRSAVGVIQNQIQSRGARPKVIPAIYSGPPDVHAVGDCIEQALKKGRHRAKPTVVLNLGLDLEMSWALVRDRILINDHVTSVSWRCLMIDPKAASIRSVASETVSLLTATRRINEIRKCCKKHDQELKRRRVDFQCRAYSHVPLIHGFLIDGNHLLYSICDIENGELVGSPNPYWQFEKNRKHKPITHLFASFTHWFEHYWTGATKIWPQ